MEQQSASFTGTNSADFSIESSPNTSTTSMTSCSSIDTDNSVTNIALNKASGMSVSPGTVNTQPVDMDPTRVELQKQRYVVLDVALSVLLFAKLYSQSMTNSYRQFTVILKALCV